MQVVLFLKGGCHCPICPPGSATATHSLCCTCMYAHAYNDGKYFASAPLLACFYVPTCTLKKVLLVKHFVLVVDEYVPSYTLFA